MSSSCVCCRPSTFRCAACNTASYCSTRCQVGDWPRHRSNCTGNGVGNGDAAAAGSSSSSSEDSDSGANDGDDGFIVSDSHVSVSASESSSSSDSAAEEENSDADNEDAVVVGGAAESADDDDSDASLSSSLHRNSVAAIDGVEVVHALGTVVLALAREVAAASEEGAVTRAALMRAVHECDVRATVHELVTRVSAIAAYDAFAGQLEYAESLFTTTTWSNAAVTAWLNTYAVVAVDTEPLRAESQKLPGHSATRCAMCAHELQHRWVLTLREPLDDGAADFAQMIASRVCYAKFVAAHRVVHFVEHMAAALYERLVRPFAVDDMHLDDAAFLAALVGSPAAREFATRQHQRFVRVLAEAMQQYAGVSTALSSGDEAIDGGLSAEEAEQDDFVQHVSRMRGSKRERRRLDAWEREVLDPELDAAEERAFSDYVEQSDNDSDSASNSDDDDNAEPTAGAPPPSSPLLSLSSSSSPPSSPSSSSSSSPPPKRVRGKDGNVLRARPRRVPRYVESEGESSE